MKDIDEKIINLYFARDEQAVTLTDKTYGRQLNHFLMGFLTLREDREEVLNDTYLDTWNAIPPTRPRILYAFLLTLSRRQAIDRIRRMKGKKRIPDSALVPLEELSEVLPDSSTVEGELLQKELSELLNDYIRSLNKDDQYIFLSRYYGLKKIDDIRKELDVSKSTVEKKLKSLRTDLSEYLRKEGYHESFERSL